ncbi:MAG: peptidase S16 [Legionellales bacterium]|nr:peptidase S16 [Legionellales bacterium]
MTRSVFNPSFEDLPRAIPVFPLTGALLLPTGKLPLNIFEPRYLAMVRDALADNQRIIGMVQPRTPDLEDNRGASGPDGDDPELYKIGCAGRITSFAEKEDGRYILTLSGVCRFDIGEEMPNKDGYRRVIADFKRFRDDISDPPIFDIDRDRLLLAVKEYFALHNIEISWDAIQATPDDKLITSLAMTCPFGPNERQALLETETASSRADLIIALLEMAILENSSTSDISH